MTTPIETETSTESAPEGPSAARAEANRRNAQKSTGPKTDLGKRRSRLNAMKHGLTARVVDFAADAARASARAESLRELYKADTPWRDYACEQAARASVMIERAASLIEVAVEDASIDADSPERWEEAQRGEVARLVKRFDRDPGPSVSKLMDYACGIDWLIAQWQMLRKSAEREGGWSDYQSHLAMDLLRFSRHQRNLAAEGAYLLTYRDEPAPDGPADVAWRMIHRLMTLRGLAKEADEARRVAAASGLADASPEVRRLTRYESGLHRRVGWLVKLLQGEAPAEVAAPAAEAPAAEARPAAPAPTADESAPRTRDETNPSKPPENETNPTPTPENETNPTPTLPIPDRKRRPDPQRLAREARRHRRRCA